MTLVGFGEFRTLSGEVDLFARFQVEDRVLDLPITEQQLEVLLGAALRPETRDVASPSRPPSMTDESEEEEEPVVIEHPRWSAAAGDDDDL